MPTQFLKVIQNFATTLRPLWGRRVSGFLWISLLCVSAAVAQDKQLLWGDTHLHTSYSFDAYINNNFTSDPHNAYRYAKGQPVMHPYFKGRVQIGTPLDFLVVSDHAEFLGSIREIHSGGGLDTSATDQAFPAR